MERLAEAGYWFLYIGIELTVLFLVVTFLVGIVRAYVTPERSKAVLERYGKGLRGNVLGAGVGGLLPFCSCSTIPMLVGLLGAGVPFGIAMSFLIASPLNVFNLVVITLFATLFGAKVAVAYSAATFVAAVVAGIALERLGLAHYVRELAPAGGAGGCGCSCGCAVAGATPLGRWERIRPVLTQAWRFAWDLFRSMLPYLLGGVAVGALIHGFVPEAFFVRYAGPDNPFAVPVAAAIGVPMYVSTSTLIPIASALVAKGVSLGTVMALIIGGAGASIPELALLWRLFHKRLFVAYIVTVFLIACAIGYLFNALAPVL
ncbi:MAG: permease [Dehalococcoidia bacterium]|jgi:hypothetical protein|nr:permease [Dehalococcoidia bacterium]